MRYGPATPFAELRDDPAAMAILERYLPGIVDEDDAFLQPFLALAELAARKRPTGESLADMGRLWSELGQLPGRERVLIPTPVAPESTYEERDVPEASAQSEVPALVERWGIAEVVLHGPAHGSPFVDVDLAAKFRCGTTEIRVGGFYDGEGVYRIRFLPPAVGMWTFETASNARSLNAITGSLQVGPPGNSNHGRVAVHDTYHFAYDDGTPYLAFGTTAYAWTHQPMTLQERTLATLTRAPFTKLRMCLFPKSFPYNWDEPPLFPFERAADGSWDLTRFSPLYFANLERRIRQLQALEIQADLILFHPYDRWGFSQMPRWADVLYTRYVVRRLAAYRNVWWSLANEYDFLRSKSTEDWDAIADAVVSEDHAGHLRSIHNGAHLYDFSRAWVTHCSIQQNNSRDTRDNVDEWRKFGKPVVIDESGYEGNLEYGWGNLTARELVRRAWDGAVRGGYVNHGETYHGDVVWWSHGGALHGESPDRFAFLAKMVAEAPKSRFEPLVSDFDFPCGGSEDHRMIYFGAAQPSRRSITLPDGTWDVDLIDTWDMTVALVAESVSTRVEIELPTRTDMAIRLRRRA
jgi:hypothetical protein